MPHVMSPGDYIQPSGIYASTMFKDITWTVPKVQEGEPTRITGKIDSLVSTKTELKQFFERYGDATKPQHLNLTVGSGRLTFHKFLLTVIGSTGETGPNDNDLAVCTGVQFTMQLWYYGETPADLAAEYEVEARRSEEEIADAMKNRVFVLIGGQTLPNQHDDAGPYIPLVDDHPSPRPEYWVKNLGQLPTPLRPIWPRHNYCRVGCQGAAGTIEELVALYRQQLEKCARQVVMYKTAPHADHAKSAENAKVHGYDPAAGKAVTFETSKMGDAKTADWLQKSSAILSTIMAAPPGDMPHAANKKFAELMQEFDPSEKNPVQLIYPNGQPAFLVAREDEDELKRLARNLPYDVDGIKIYYRLLPQYVDRIDLFNPPESSQSVMDPKLTDNG